MPDDTLLNRYIEKMELDGTLLEAVRPLALAVASAATAGNNDCEWLTRATAEYAIALIRAEIERDERWDRRDGIDR